MITAADYGVDRRNAGTGGQDVGMKQSVLLVSSVIKPKHRVCLGFHYFLQLNCSVWRC